MFWIVKLKDGSVLRQEYDNSFADINKKEIASIILRETPKSQSLLYDNEANQLRFPNLNFDDVKGKEVLLSMMMDPETLMFSFTPESKAFLDKVLIREEQLYSSFGIGQDGDLLINNVKSNFSIFEVDTKEDLLSQPIERNLDYFRTGFSDMVVGNSSKKLVTGVDSVSITQEGQYSTSFGVLSVKQEFKYMYDTRSLYMDVLIRSEFDSQKVLLSIQNPDKLMTYNIVLSKDYPTHLGTYIYMFNN